MFAMLIRGMLFSRTGFRSFFLSLTELVTGGEGGRKKREKRDSLNITGIPAAREVFPPSSGRIISEFQNFREYRYIPIIWVGCMFIELL